MVGLPDIVRFFADGTLLLIIAIGAVTMIRLLVSQPKMWGMVPVIIMAGMTSLLVGKLVSLAYQPSLVRPFVLQGSVPGAAFIDNPGFPSDHALLGAAIVLVVAVFARHRTVSVVLICLLMAMCVGRVLALVHTPFDVLGGLAAGAIGGLWYLSGGRFYRA